MSLCAALLAAPAIAPIEEPSARSLPPLVRDIVITAADPAGFDSKAVSADRLAGKRAGTDTVTSDMQLNGAVSGNTAVNVFTGANSISTGSFSNASGLPVAIQNSGANVLIQNATIINIQMQ
jgi:hypothetical protein